MTAIDLEMARRAWVAVMGTDLERQAQAAYAALVEKAKRQ